MELFQLIFPLVVIHNHWVSPTYKGLNISTSSSVDCGPPPGPWNVSLESYTNTTEGSVVFYSCDSGLVPERRMMSLCTGSGWSPNPADLNCSVGMFKINGKYLMIVCCMKVIVSLHVIIREWGRQEGVIHQLHPLHCYPFLSCPIYYEILFL